MFFIFSALLNQPSISYIVIVPSGRYVISILSKRPEEQSVAVLKKSFLQFLGEDRL